MVCQNCQSKDVIKVQDQFFCVNCGNLVAAPRPKISTPTVVVAPLMDDLPDGVTILPLAGTVILDKPAKRKRPGRPKAARLDQPVAVGGMRDIAIGFTSTLEPALTEPEVIASTPTSPTPHHSTRHFSDIAPAHRSAPAHTQPATAKPASNAPEPQPVQFSDLMSASIRGRFNAAHLCLALLPAILLAFLGGFVVMALAGDYTSVSRLIPSRALVPLGGELVIIALLYYVSRSFMHGAIVYGASRQSDHRPAPVIRWIDISASSFGTRLRFDVLSLLAQVGVLALIGSLVVTGGLVWPIPAWLQLALLSGAFFAMVYLLAGLMLAQGLGHVAVTLSTVTARKAFGIGWIFFRHHFELMGIKLLTLLVELILLIPLGAAIAALILLAPSGYDWLVVTGLVIGVMIAGASTGAASALWWQAAYRKLVKSERLTEAVGLLTGRKLTPSRGHATTWMMILMLVLATAAAIWPWLSL
jgi:hypothetical protein